MCAFRHGWLVQLSSGARSVGEVRSQDTLLRPKIAEVVARHERAPVCERALLQPRDARQQG
jgi:hypothetical protein